MLTEVKILHSQHLIQDKYNTIGYHRNYSGHWLVATMSAFKSTIILQCTSKRTRSICLSYNHTKLICKFVVLSNFHALNFGQKYIFDSKYMYVNNLQNKHTLNFLKVTSFNKYQSNIFKGR
jgi:hypothetical protein